VSPTSLPQMLLPAVWQNNKRRMTANINTLNAKRQRIKNDESREECVLDEIECIVKDTLRTNPPVAVPLSELRIDTDSILNDIPFERLLMNMKGVEKMPDVPIVTRVYEERFMRESTSTSEKNCVMGVNCECMVIDPLSPFVCTQFVIPNVANTHQGMCVLCLRKTTQLLYYKTIYNGHNVNAVIQKYGNICNQEDEYHPSVMLICPPNGPVHTMPVPIVSHQRNRYKVEVISGIKHIRQLRVRMSDFR